MLRTLTLYMPTDINVGCKHLSEYTTLQISPPAFHLVQQKLPCSSFANLLCTAVVLMSYACKCAVWSQKIMLDLELNAKYVPNICHTPPMCQFNIIYDSCVVHKRFWAWNGSTSGHQFQM